MSENGAEKRFDATPSRRDRAKRDGQSARSHEVAGIASFVAAFAGLLFVLPLLANAAAAAVRASVASLPAAPGVHAGALVALALVPALCAAGGATAVSLAQTGGLRVAPVTFAIGKLAPWPGIKRMFGAEAAVGAARALVAFAVVIATMVPVVVHAVLASTASGTLTGTASIVRDALVRACCSAAAVGVAFALADYALVHRRWLHGLKMTFDEFRRDAKDQDGDPHAKSRRRSMHRTFARGGIARVREASFVIANPTHIAIAIRYAPPAVPVPQILVRAADALALEVRALAERAGIPIVADVPLARLLWKIGEAGRPIPAESFVAVATTIAALMRAGMLAE